MSFQDFSLAVCLEVLAERKRHALLIMQGKFVGLDTIGIPNAHRMMTLTEEFGEVAKEVREELHVQELNFDQGQRTIKDMVTNANYGKGSGTNAIRAELAGEIRRRMRRELLQTASVCVAWVEALDAEQAALDTERNAAQGLHCPQLSAVDPRCTFSADCPVHSPTQPPTVGPPAV